MKVERLPRRAALEQFSAKAPPTAVARSSETVVHGRVLRDDYAWLKAANWKEVLKAPEKLPSDIRAYLEEENAFAATVL